MARTARAAKHAPAARAAGSPVVPAYREADALSLPFEDGSFDAATIGFGLRNLPDYAAGLREMRRVVRPGGRVVILEIAVPQHGIPHLLFETWFRRIVPVLGRVAGRSSAYHYLPASLLAYPPPESIAAMMEEVGLERIRWRRLPSQMATLHVGERPAE